MAKTATERMEAARDATMDGLTCELALAAIFMSRAWPSFVAAPLRQDQRFAWVLCIDSPAGRIVYKVTEGEREAMLSHVPEKPNDGIHASKADRLSRLLHLATEGWTK